MTGIPTLRTERLVLRPFEMRDATDVQGLAGDPAIADTTLLIPHPYEDGMAETWIATHGAQCEDGQGYNFAIALSAADELLGAISLGVDAKYGKAELGYWIGQPYWGQGYCTEAAREVLRFGFSDLQLRRVYAFCFARNLASARVLQKIGMQHEGCLRQDVRRWEEYEDLEIYAALREEWAQLFSE